MSQDTLHITICPYPWSFASGKCGQCGLPKAQHIHHRESTARPTICNACESPIAPDRFADNAPLGGGKQCRCATPSNPIRVADDALYMIAGQCEPDLPSSDVDPLDLMRAEDDGMLASSVALMGATFAALEGGRS